MNFLLNRPYFTGYQGTQSGLFATDSGWHQVKIDTLGALPRGGNGDNYGGWSAANSWYVSQVPGWYLVMFDGYASVPSATTATLLAGIFCSSSGGITPAASPDIYQNVYCPVTTGTSPPGAFAMGMYYLAKGEYVYPMLEAIAWGGSWNTFVNSNTAHLVYSQLSCFWVSE